MKKMTTYKDFVGELTVNYRRTKKPTVQITSSRVAADFIRPEFDHVMDDHEVAKVIHVNHENMIVNVHHVSSGTDTATLIPVKTIIRNAILIQTTGIILVHNHPSGQTKFSKADIRV
jgi:DNA repair protein RadC